MSWIIKTCLACKQTMDLSSFGSNQATKDRLNCYCKACVRKKARIRRRAMGAKPKRKRMQFSPLTTGTPQERVRRCYERNITNQIAIKAATGITEDQVADAIATLNDRGVIRWNSEQRAFQIAA